MRVELVLVDGVIHIWVALDHLGVGVLQTWVQLVHLLLHQRRLVVEDLQVVLGRRLVKMLRC